MKKKYLIFLVLIAQLTMIHAQSDSTILFKDGDGGYKAYRIPALLKTAKGTLLAFAEARWKGLDDAFDIDLVLRRSFDGGKTWQPTQMVWDDGENTCGNPVPVQDPTTGRIFLFMNWNYGPDEQDKIEAGTSQDTRRIYLCYSDDEGATWTKPEDLTTSLKNISNETWHGVGPCHGMVKTREPHKGRIIIPVYYKNRQQRGYAHVFYSDDHGATWHRGHDCVPQLGCRQGSSESTVVELSDGRLYMSMRTVGPRDSVRHYAISTDGGERWSNHLIDSTLYDPRCQAAITNASMGMSGPTLLYLHQHHPTRRRDLTLSVSHNNGQTWDCSYYIHNDAAYCDLAMLNKKEVGVIYEADYYTKIVFKTILLSK
ncbi:MAG: exo-alpha-sialidase [Bacteroidales bacterium]|nr:exo-alpha-sialidase [Candidatus Colimorpha onthohippi]